jgi:signal transduction histidine kinase
VDKPLENPVFFPQKSFGAELAKTLWMSSLENIYQKMVPTLEPATLAQLHHDSPEPEPPPRMAREVAHELNNILTIVQGYADRLVLKYGENPALRADLQVITENARRAIKVVREASPRRSPAFKTAV